MLEEILDVYPEKEFLKADGLDDAIIGVDETNYRLIYSVKKCIEIMVENGNSYSEAIEYLEFNTFGANIENGPIWCHDNFNI